MVIYSVTMPTDMVGVIRRSLESSQSTFSTSSSYGSCKGSKVKPKQVIDWIVLLCRSKKCLLQLKVCDKVAD